MPTKPPAKAVFGIRHGDGDEAILAGCPGLENSPDDRRLGAAQAGLLFAEAGDEIRNQGAQCVHGRQVHEERKIAADRCFSNCELYVEKQYIFSIGRLEYCRPVPSNELGYGHYKVVLQQIGQSRNPAVQDDVARLLDSFDFQFGNFVQRHVAADDGSDKFEAVRLWKK
jgi:hypothetical protein